MWHKATEQMHIAGEEALVAWAELAGAARVAAEESERVRWSWQERALEQALGCAAAWCLEVELFETLGLAGLTGTASVSEPWDSEGSSEGAEKLNTDRGDKLRPVDYGQSTPATFSYSARLQVIAAMLGTLRRAGALHAVGEALLCRQGGRSFAGRPGGVIGEDADVPFGALPVPIEVLEGAVALITTADQECQASGVQMAALEAACSFSLMEDPRSVDASALGLARQQAVVAVWLTTCLAAAVREAVRRGHVGQAASLLALGRLLGDSPLEGALECVARSAQDWDPADVTWASAAQKVSTEVHQDHGQDSPNQPENGEGEVLKARKAAIGGAGYARSSCGAAARFAIDCFGSLGSQTRQPLIQNLL